MTVPVERERPFPRHDTGEWWERHSYSPPWAKPVVCELCLRDQHDRCVRPCVCRHEILSEEVSTTGITKHGAGDILREPEDVAVAKVASSDWTEEDAKALDEENANADADSD